MTLHASKKFLYNKNDKCIYDILKIYILKGL